jgi:hypothetical protein
VTAAPVLLPLPTNSLDLEEDDLSPKAISREVVFFVARAKMKSDIKILSLTEGLSCHDRNSQ